MPTFAPSNIDSSASSGFSVAVKNRKTETNKKIRLEITTLTCRWEGVD
jgi:hypothetical protein